MQGTRQHPVPLEIPGLQGLACYALALPCTARVPPRPKPRQAINNHLRTRPWCDKIHHSHLPPTWCWCITKVQFDKDVHLALHFPSRAIAGSPDSDRHCRGRVLRRAAQPAPLQRPQPSALPGAMERSRPSGVLLHTPGYPGQRLALRLVHRPGVALFQRTLRRARQPRALRFPDGPGTAIHPAEPRQPARGLHPPSEPRRHD
ncbi:hypothetical protein D9M71_602930 [compost metagenome]